MRKIILTEQNMDLIMRYDALREVMKMDIMMVKKMYFIAWNVRRN